MENNKTFFFSTKDWIITKWCLGKKNQNIWERTIANIMNKQFINITNKLKLKQLKPTETETNKLAHHQRLPKTTKTFLKYSFKWRAIRIYSHVWRSIKNYYSLKNNKLSLSFVIPVKILQMFSGSFLLYLGGAINHSIATFSFPDELKLV